MPSIPHVPGKEPNMFNKNIFDTLMEAVNNGEIISITQESKPIAILIQSDLLGELKDELLRKSTAVYLKKYADKDVVDISISRSLPVITIRQNIFEEDSG